MTALDWITLRNLVLLVLVLIGVFLALRRGWPGRVEGASLEFDQCVLYGANLIVDGFEYYPDWSAAMRREFAGVTPHLKLIYDAAQKLADLPKSQWKTQAAKLASELSENEAA